MADLSLCIPTNGVTEWVMPVLESIYSQGIDENYYEVIVTNNGDHAEFHQKMVKYAQEHKNLVYRQTKSYMFDNQLDALRLAKGSYLKFVNHRTVLENGALKTFLGIVRKNRKKKPVLFFANGQLKSRNLECHCLDFDEFVRRLGHLASWTTGVGIWKEDFDRILPDMNYDKISPHSGVLFSERKKDAYIIDNRVLVREIDESHVKKGRYDLFRAFAVEEPSITLDLLRDGDISVKTFRAVKNEYKHFAARCYCDFCIRKVPCSYELKGFDDAVGVYFERWEVLLLAWLYFVGGRVRCLWKGRR